jgi:hypothetical protein
MPQLNFILIDILIDTTLLIIVFIELLTAFDYIDDDVLNVHNLLVGIS